MLTLQDVSFVHANGDQLFSHINLTINKGDKAALIGNNGAGKSTLLNILAGNLHPTEGLVKLDSKPYYLPQVFGQFNHLSVAEALRIDVKLKALQEILNGHVTDENLLLLDNDWAIEQRCTEALHHWKLDEVRLDQKIGSVSGGQKTKIFLAGLRIHEPDVVLLDEPSNHLDTESRAILYDYIMSTNSSALVVSHDRSLLKRLSLTYELQSHGIIAYGGNYDFYTEQKKILKDAFEDNLRSKQKALQKAKEVERETMERQQRNDSRGRKKQEKAGMPTIMINTMRNSAERSTAHVKEVHAGKITALANELSELRMKIPAIDKMKMDLNHSRFHAGKVLVTATNVNFFYHHRKVWSEDLSFQIRSGERIAIKGSNGSGKTTLTNLILGMLQPKTGVLVRVQLKSMYIDQDYSLLDDTLTVYEVAQHHNDGSLPEHEIKTRLNRFLFTKDDWDKTCKALSGGERMRLMLCALTIHTHAPDLIVLDEPTNNLDLQNIEILTTAIKGYLGTLIVVSHDEQFLSEIQIERELRL